MSKFVPSEILSWYSEGATAKEISGSVLFLDIKGFTSMTEQLMKSGKIGSELLSKIINSFFGSVISEIYGSGGFITSFAGDAFTALFPENRARNSLHCASSISSKVAAMKPFNTPAGGFKLSVKISVSSGRMKMHFIGEEKKLYLLKGQCLKSIEKMQKAAGENEIICDSTTYRMFPQAKYEASGRFYRVLKGAKLLKPVDFGAARRGEKDFLVNDVYAENPEGEFRNIVSLFINFKKPSDLKKLHSFVNKAVELSERYGCFLNMLEYSDKGLVCYVIFGAPKAREKDILNSALFAYEMADIFGGEVRCGLSYGTAYFGKIGSAKRYSYTAVSSVVNLAARVMMKAEWGEVLSEKVFIERAGERVKSEKIIDASLKGIEGDVKLYRLTGLAVKGSKGYTNRFIGRKREISEIQSVFADAGKNMGALFVFGDAGIGKTRIVAESLKPLSERAEIFSAHADEIVKSALDPFKAYIENKLGIADDLKADDKNRIFELEFAEMLKKAKRAGYSSTSELERTAIFLKNFIGAENSIEKVYEPKVILDNTLIGIKEFIKTASKIKPQAIVIDDAQWLDETALKFLPQLFTNISDFPFLLTAVSRIDAELEKSAGKIKNSRIITLGALDSASIKGIMEGILAGPVSQSLAEFIVQKGEGNPFFTEQLLLYLKENGSLKYTPGGFVMAGRDSELFSGINSVIIARIDHLSSDLKNIVQHASVLGKEFETDILTKMLKREDIKESMTEGVEQNIWNVASELKYIFSHSLLKEAAYEMQLNERLTKLHADAASFVEEKHPSDPLYYNDLAFHYERSGNRAKAEEYVRKAAEFARYNYRESDAYELYLRLEGLVEGESAKLEVGLEIGRALFYMAEYRKAMDFIGRKMESISDKKSLIYAKYLSALLESKLRTGELESALQDAKESYEIYKEQGARKDEIRTLKNIGRIYYDMDVYDEAIVRYEESLALAQNEGFEGLAYEIMGSMGLYYFEKSEYDKGIELLEQKIEYNRKKNMKREMCYAMGNLGLMVWKKGDLDKALSIFDEILKVAQEQGDRYSYSASLSNIGMIYYYKHRYADALKCYDEAFAINEELGNKYFMAINLGNIGNVYSAYGEFDTAEEYYNICANMFEEIKNPWCLRLSYQEMAELNFMKKDFTKMRELTDKSYALAKKMDIPEGIAASLSLSVECYYEVGDFDSLRRAVIELDEVSNKTGLEKYRYYCMLYRALDTARENIDEGEKMLNKLIDDTKEADLKARVSYFLYRTANTEANRKKALSLHQKALEENESYELKTRLEELKQSKRTE